MNPNDFFFPLRPFKEIRKLYSAMVAGNTVTVHYYGNGKHRTFSGFVWDVGVDNFHLVPSLTDTDEKTELYYTNLIKITISYVLEHNRTTILSTITAARETMMNRLYDDMVGTECVDIYTTGGTIYDTKLVYSISLEGIMIKPDFIVIPYSNIAMISECQRFEEKLD
ncbi:MAG: hypothetical protein QXL94_03345 [Candidatus Parvarchaeum sp.]